MLRQGAVVLSFIGLSLTIFVVPIARADIPPGCTINRENGQVVCSVADDGEKVEATAPTQNPGSPTDQSQPNPVSDGDGPPEARGPYSTGEDGPPCLSPPGPADPLPSLLDPSWEGHTPDDKTGQMMYCESDLNGMPFFYWAPITAAAPPLPPVDREALSRAARALITLPDTTSKVGPDLDAVVVNAWTWMWIDYDRGTKLSDSASDRGISVAVTARPEAVIWSPGEPMNCSSGSTCGEAGASSFECKVVTTPPPADVDPLVQPECGYRYKWRSTAERTNGSQKWTLEASVRWRFTWSTTGTGAAVGAARGSWTEIVPLDPVSFNVAELRGRLVSCGGPVDC